MSTILKALRRLEDDQAPDPNSSDVLREQILAEELAAHAALGGDEESTPRSAALLVFLKHRGPALATVVILLGAALVIGISLRTPDRDASVNGQTNAQAKAQSNTLATPGSTRQPVAATGPPANPPASPMAGAPRSSSRHQAAQAAAPAPGSASTQRPASFAVRPAPPTPGPNAIVDSEPASVPKPSPSAEPTSAPARVALRPVEAVKRSTTNTSPVSRRPSTPIAALPMESSPTLGAKLEASSPASPPPPVEVALAKKPAGSPVPSPAPRPALAAAPRVGASSNAEAASLRLAPTPTPKATPTRAVPEVVRRKTPMDLPRIAKPAIPDVSVLRTAWHPQPERRSARIQLAKSEDVMTLREGDAVGSLVVKEITPSSVLFAAGDVELRRRVGN